MVTEKGIPLNSVNALKYCYEVPNTSSIVRKDCVLKKIQDQILCFNAVKNISITFLATSTAQSAWLRLAQKQVEKPWKDMVIYWILTEVAWNEKG